MKTKHTPGPWRSAGKFILTSEKEKKDRSIATCELISTNEWGGPSEEVEANALLIAAAPDLLEACRLALEYRKQTHHGDDRALNVLVDAIKKATE